jgi:hypothetical protein
MLVFGAELGHERQLDRGLHTRIADSNQENRGCQENFHLPAHSSLLILIEAVSERSQVPVIRVLNGNGRLLARNICSSAFCFLLRNPLADCNSE